jgi:hypothetical protein
VKITIVIPDPLYKKAMIRAVETGRTLEQVILACLENELNPFPSTPEREPVTWANRKLMPAYETALKAGALSGGTDSTVIISEDRSSREEALGS